MFILIYKDKYSRELKMESKETLKVFVNEESFGQKNLLTITGKVEIAESTKGNYYVKELIYLSFTNAFNTNSTITMQLKGIDIYNLMNALEETTINKSSKYKKFTDSSKSNNSEKNTRKFIAVKYDTETEKIFINLNIQESSNDYKTTSYVVFETFEVKGVIKTLEMFMIEYKNFFYKTQRAYEKVNKKNRG